MLNQTTRRDLLSAYLGVVLTTASAILFEISLTKIFSVTLWYHFAFFAVSLALFGLGAGGLVVFFGRRFFAGRFPGNLKNLAFLQFASMILCLSLVLMIHTDGWMSIKTALSLTAVFFLCAVPFCIVGVILSLVMRHWAEDAPKLYFADLLGSGLACILFVLAISLVSGPTVILMASLLALVASIFFSERGNRSQIMVRTAVLLTWALCLFVLNANTNLFRVKYTKAFKERQDLLFEKWSPLARITVYPGVWWKEDPNNPFGWGMSKKFKPEKPIEQLWIEQDASAGTPITRFSGDIEELGYLKYDITSFAYHVHPSVEDVFIIGAGGGRDVLTALAFGVPAIKACDINRVIVDLVRNRFRDYAGGIYDLDMVDMEVAEGRSCVRRQKTSFDIIQISLIDSWASTLAGAFSLAENNLYTVQAFSDYLDHLDDDGYLSLTRFLFLPRNQTLRVAILARRALEQNGMANPERALAVISTDKEWGTATTLVKKTAFTPKEIESIRDKAEEIGFSILYLPDDENSDPDFMEAMTAQPLQKYLKTTYHDLRPPTDNRPFFFQMMYFTRALDLLSGEAAASGQKFNSVAPLVLIFLLLLSGVMVGVFYFVPLTLSREAKRLPRLWGAYFILLGLGFMFVEIYLLQRGSLYLEHPTLSLSAVLFSMLTAAGFGSFWTRRVITKELFPALRHYLFLTLILLVLLGFGAGWMCQKTIGLPLPIKVPLFVVMVALVGFFMGTLFPSGLRLVCQVHEASVPWVWALNGCASVTSSILAMSIAMMFGYTQTLVVGFACYASALFIVYRLQTEHDKD